MFELKVVVVGADGKDKNVKVVVSDEEAVFFLRHIGFDVPKEAVVTLMLAD